MDRGRFEKQLAVILGADEGKNILRKSYRLPENLLKYPPFCAILLRQDTAKKEITDGG